MADEGSKGTAKYVNFRVSAEDFIEIKIAALKAGKTLGEYMLGLHKAYHDEHRPPNASAPDSA